ncbi:MAG: AAA family ATPase [Anaerolineaceae bacterium]|nr:AAA family ATPase [Anaerolineaceae bacterium]
MTEIDKIAHLYVLGPVQIERDDGSPLQGFESRKAVALLCYLAVQSQPVSRTHLADLFWGEKSEERGRGNLSRVLHNISSILPDCLQIDRHLIQFRRPTVLWLDADVFHDLARSAEVEDLAIAATLYRGDLMADFYLDDSPQFETWLVAERESWHLEFRQVLQKLVNYYWQNNDFRQGLNYARQLLALDPWREEVHRQVMQLLAVTGQRSAALTQYETCRRILAEELAIEPALETMTLYEQIRAGELSPMSNDVAFYPGSPTSIPTFTATSPLPALFSTQPVLAAHTPFVARQQELDQLNNFLDLALTGAGSVAFVMGEAGSGKTALLQEFARRAQAQHPELIIAGGNCNAYGGVGDPYLPFREILDWLTGDVETKWGDGIFNHDYLQRLWQLIPFVVHTLVNTGSDLIDIFTFDANLVARVAATAPTGAPWLTQLKALVAEKKEAKGPASYKQRDLFNQYTKLLQTLAKRVPLLIVIDDLQWADVGSISLLFHLGRRLTGSRILIVGIYRESDVAVGRDGQRHPLSAVLNEFRRRFGSAQLALGEVEPKDFTEALLDTQPNRLDAAFREALHRHTKGNALFTLEMLGEMERRGALIRDEAGCWLAGPQLDWTTLPVRIEGVIGERLSRLPVELYETLKIASVEGENFKAEVVAQVQAVDERVMIRRLSHSLDQQHHLVLAQGRQWLGAAGPRLSFYRFRHSLFQHYLYNSLDDVERAFLHEVIGGILEQLYAGQTEDVAAQLALHFEAAGLPDQAINYFLLAGQRSMKAAAYDEAIVNYRKGLRLLETAAGVDEPAQKNLKLYLALGQPLVMTQGYAAPEVEQIYLEAQRLLPEIDELGLMIPVIRGLWNCYLVRAEHHRAEEWSSRLFDLAEQSHDPIACIEAHWIKSETMFALGQFDQARQHQQEAIARYDYDLYEAYPYRAVQDPGLSCRHFHAATLWLLGYPDQAMAQIEAALTQARTLRSDFGLSGALYFKALLHQFQQEPVAAEMESRSALTLARQKGFSLLKACTTIVYGWALAKQDQVESGLILIRQGLAILRETRALVWFPYFLTLLAEAYAHAGQTTDALAVLDEALDIVAQSGDRWWAAELYRLKGDVLSRSNAPAEAVEAHFQQAITLARQQNAKSLELRAVTSLAQLWQRQGQTIAAGRQLAEIYNWFSEGRTTADHQAAQTLLAGLMAV